MKHFILYKDHNHRLIIVSFPDKSSRWDFAFKLRDRIWKECVIDVEQRNNYENFINWVEYRDATILKEGIYESFENFIVTIFPYIL